MRFIFLLAVSTVFLSCSTTNAVVKSKAKDPVTYANTITANELKEMLYVYASNEFEGRDTGSKGQKLAVNYLKTAYQTMGVDPAKADGNYFQEITDINSENVVAFIRGSEYPEEYIVISAHLDHIGISANGEINNGADDDGSGTVAILEIAEAFKQAVMDGNGPKRSLVFLHVTGEEKGLLGSRYYTDVDPIVPIHQTIANLNIDMIGRIDPKRDGNRNYVYLIGSDRLSTELHKVSEEVNAKYTNIELDYTFNAENDPNRYYYRSDHFNFAKKYVPVIFYFNGTHDDYHRPSDTPDKIEYDLLENRTRLIFHTAWELANREDAVKLDFVRVAE